MRKKIEMRGVAGAVASQNVVDGLSSLLRQKGVGSYEIFYSMESGFGAEAQNGSVEALKARQSSGAGLRVISKSRQGFGFSSVLTPAALTALVDGAVSASAGASADDGLAFPAAHAKKAVVIEGLFDDTFFSTPEAEKIDLALCLERSAMSASPKMARVRKASYSESLQYVRIVNSNGVDLEKAATFYSASVTAVAEEGGESQMGWDIGMGHKRSLIDAEAVGKAAANSALRMLGARTMKTVKCPAVIENTVACELLEALVSSFMADNVHKGKSMLAGKLGTPVASRAVNVWDDGLLKDGWATSAFDGEGAPRQKTALIINGIAEGYLYDTYWAKKDGVKSTGSGARSGFKSLPSLGASNVFIDKGALGFEALLKELGTGLFITEVLGVHTVNTVSGEFSLGASGLWVEGGKAVYPVRGMALSGTLLGLFSKVTRCGSDTRFIGSVGSPSLLVSELEVSGA